MTCSLASPGNATHLKWLLYFSVKLLLRWKTLNIHNTSPVFMPRKHLMSYATLYSEINYIIVPQNPCHLQEVIVGIQTYSTEYLTWKCAASCQYTVQQGVKQGGVCATQPLKLSYTLSYTAPSCKMSQPPYINRLMAPATQLRSLLPTNDEEMCIYILNAPSPDPQMHSQNALHYNTKM